MSQRGLANMLKGVVVGMAVCGLIFYLYLLPEGAKIMFFEDAQYQPYYTTWLIFIWITALPAYFVLLCGWRVAAEIGKDNSFSAVNAKQLKYIAVLAAADSLFVFVVSLIFFILKMVEDSWMLMAVLISIGGVMITVLAAALSHLIYKAAALEEENELTI